VSADSVVDVPSLVAAAVMIQQKSQAAKSARQEVRSPEQKRHGCALALSKPVSKRQASTEASVVVAEEEAGLNSQPICKLSSG